MRFPTRALLAIAVLTTATGHAESEISVPAAEQAPSSTDKEEGQGATRQGKSGDTFESWGLGVAAAVEFYDDEYIETATIQGDDRLVVVEKATKSQPAVWAVGNWTLDQCFWECEWIRPGLFFGLKLAGESGIGFEGLGIGLQLAFLQNAELRSGDEGKKPSWNIGIGWVNHRTRQFAEGIVEGQPLPADFQDIRYRESWDSGWMIMIAKNVY